MRKPSPQPWWTNLPARMRFERDAREAGVAFTTTATGRGRRADVIYRFAVPVPMYDVTRQVAVRFGNGAEPWIRRITVDGPTDSDHRFGPNELCVQFDGDPATNRWVADDGLHQLILLTEMHLAREERVRETGEPWPGPEAAHDEAMPPLPRRLRRRRRRPPPRPQAS